MPQGNSEGSRPVLSARQATVRNPDYAHRNDVVPKDRLCQCCSGDLQRNYEPLRYEPSVKFWLCKSCRELHLAELEDDDTPKENAVPDRSSSVRVVRSATKGGKRK